MVETVHLQTLQILEKKLGGRTSDEATETDQRVATPPRPLTPPGEFHCNFHI